MVPNSNQYSPGPATLLYGRPQNSVRGLTVVFDSGSSYTYFANRAYQPLLTSVGDSATLLVGLHAAHLCLIAIGAYDRLGRIWLVSH